MAEELADISDSRVVFIASYLLKTFKVKAEKWHKFYAIEESKLIIQEFLDKNEQSLLVFSMNSSQALSVSYAYPNQLKTKACYFAKKKQEALGKDLNIKDALLYGDLSYSPLDQLSAILDELLVPVFNNSHNQTEWPKVISDDLIRHINNLKNKTYVISGQIKGKTQLPIPSGADRVSNEDIERAQR
jgi:dynein heavy chain, axonemal